MKTTIEEQTRRALIRAQRRIVSLGHTKASFARHLGIPEATFSGWFRKTTISLATLVTLANAIGMHPAVMLMSAHDMLMLKGAIEALRAHPQDVNAMFCAQQLETFLKGKEPCEPRT